MGVGSGGDGGSRGCGTEWGRGLTLRNHILDYVDSVGPRFGEGTSLCGLLSRISIGYGSLSLN